MYIVVCYLSCVCGLVLLGVSQDFVSVQIPEFPSTLQALVFVPLSLVAAGLWKYQSGICIGVLLTLGVYFELMKTTWLHVCVFIVRHTWYNVLRYCMYFPYVMNRVADIQSGMDSLPFYSLVSNFAHVIEKRGASFMVSFLGNEAFAGYVAIGFFALAALAAALCSRTKPRNNTAYVYGFKPFRAMVVSGIAGCSMTFFLNVGSVVNDSSDEHVLIPLTVMFLTVLANQQLFKYAPYWLHAIVCPVASVALSACLFAFAEIDTKTVYAFVTSAHYLLVDPIRYILYITQQVEVTSLYFTCDVLALCVAHVLFWSNKSLLLEALIASIVWLGLTLRSIRLYQKDCKLAECSRLLHMI